MFQVAIVVCENNEKTTKNNNDCIDWILGEMLQTGCKS